MRRPFVSVASAAAIVAAAALALLPSLRPGLRAGLQAARCSVTRCTALADELRAGAAFGVDPALVAPAVSAEPDASIAGERARPARAFVDSVGVATHFSYDDSGYARAFDTVARRLHEGGIHHLRDEVHDDPAFLRRLHALDELGMRGTFIVAEDAAKDGRLFVSRDALRTFATSLPTLVAAYEAPNELDLSDPAYVENAPALERELWHAVRDEPALHDVRVVGPSLTKAGAYLAVGNLASWLDRGNIHDYLYGYPPETDGTIGGGPIGGLGAWWNDVRGSLRAARAVSADKPVQSTETGYCTNPSLHTLNNVSLRVQERYVPRLFLAHFAAGIVETDYFELVDTPAEGPDYAYCGLLYADGRPKPAFVALTSLLGVLADAPGSFETGTLKYGIEAGAGDVARVLLEKHDRTFDLVLWLAEPAWNPMQNLPGSDRTVAPKSVLVRFGAPVRAVTNYAYGNDARLHASRLTLTGGAVRVTLTDRVAVLVVKPGTR